MSKGQQKGLTTMGMAASQARLLTITARLHDVEYQAQSIQNAKLALATQEDKIQKEYNEALDATTLTIKDYKGNVIPATFNNLCGINAVDVGDYRYALRNSKGQLIVSQEIAEEYTKFMSDDVNVGEKNAFTFAMYMLTGGEITDSDEFESSLEEVLNGYSVGEEAKKPHSENKQAVDDILKSAFDLISKYDESYSDSFDEDDTFNGNLSLIEQGMEDLDDKQKAEVQELIDKALEARSKYLNQLFNSKGEEIFDSMGYKTDYNSADFEYYRDMFNQIEANGGSCVCIDSVEDYNGLKGTGTAANDGDWLQDMIKSGKITVEQVLFDKKTGSATFKATGVSSDSLLEYTTTSNIDKKALAKAEAEYEYKMKQIDRKDKAFDMDLSKLESERTALTTEYDSVKKVISDNIDRTFGIFS